MSDVYSFGVDVLNDGRRKDAVWKSDYDALAAELAEARRCLDGGTDCMDDKVKLRAALRVALDYIELDSEIPAWISELRKLTAPETKPAPGFCSECLMTGGHKLSCSKAETEGKP